MIRLFNMIYGVAVLLMLICGCQSRVIQIDDMKMTEENFYSVFGTKVSRGSINTDHPWLHIWDKWIENGQYRIPYSWSSVPNDTRTKISEAFDNFTDGNLCFKFVERANEEQFINFTDDALGCWSHVGRLDPRHNLTNTLNLQDPGCVHTGIIIHEIMHALGFYHEHQRPDRDEYVRIVESNITPGKENNFLKWARDVINSGNVSYDFHSIMHYHPMSFGINGAATIQLANGSDLPTSFYQRSRLTDLDKEQLQLLYPCPAVDSTTAGTSSATTTPRSTTSIATTTEATTTSATTTMSTAPRSTTTVAPNTSNEPTTASLTTTMTTTTTRSTTTVAPNTSSEPTTTGSTTSVYTTPSSTTTVAPNTSSEPTTTSSTTTTSTTPRSTTSVASTTSTEATTTPPRSTTSGDMATSTKESTNNSTTSVSTTPPKSTISVTSTTTTTTTTTTEATTSDGKSSNTMSFNMLQYFILAILATMLQKF